MNGINIIQSAREIKVGGGVSGVAYYLEKNFKKKGYNCSRFTIESLGIKSNSSYRLKLFVKLKLTFDVIAYSIFGSLRLRWKFQKDPDSIIISHNDSLYGDIYVMHGLHKSVFKKTKNKLFMLLRNPLHIFLLIREEFRYRFSNHLVIITLSQENKKEILKYYPINEQKIHVIPNGVDIDKFQPSNETRILTRKELNIEMDDIVLLFVGQEFNRKGLAYVIKALNHFNLSDNQIKLLVIGSDDISKYIQKTDLNLRRENIIYLGYKKDVDKFFKMSDIFILPSLYEAWPLVGLEAMACGLPILMTPVGGVREFLLDGINGFFIQRDPKDIADKVKILVDDKELYKKMSINARNTALNYSWDKIADQYIEIIERVHQTKKKDEV